MCSVTIDEGVGTHMKTFHQGCNLAGVECPAARQNLGNHTLAAYLGQVTGQCKREQDAEHFCWGKCVGEELHHLIADTIHEPESVLNGFGRKVKSAGQPLPRYAALHCPNDHLMIMYR